MRKKYIIEGIIAVIILFVELIVIACGLASSWSDEYFLIIFIIFTNVFAVYAVALIVINRLLNSDDD